MPGLTVVGARYKLMAALFVLAGSASAHISQLVPSQVTAGSPAFTLVVLGQDIEPQEILLWNGTPLATTFISSSEVRAAIPASLIAAGLYPNGEVATITLQGFNSLPLTINPPAIGASGPQITTPSPLLKR